MRPWAARLAWVRAVASAGGKSPGRFPNAGVVLLDIVRERGDPRGLRPRARRHAPRHRAAERIGQRASIRPGIARWSSVAFSSKRRISTAHSTGAPLPPSASRPSAARVIRRDAPIDVRRERPVDLELGSQARLRLSRSNSPGRKRTARLTL